MAQSGSKDAKCPTCGKAFENVSNVSNHHGAVHPNEWEDRFWMYVKRIEDECWEWGGNIAPIGYGKMSVQGEERYAHRMSYEIRNGEIPEGKCVLHHCDNRSCVNPNHLYAGTKSDNLKDAWDRNQRTARDWFKGESVPWTKITEEQAKRIKELLGGDMTHKEISEE